MMKAIWIPALPVLAATLSACASGEWRTGYADVVSAGLSRNWNVADIDVLVPETLMVSEADSYAPEADILWKGEPLGNRYQQVDSIITEAAARGSAGLTGSRPVRLNIVVSQFHAMTDRARARLSNSGVHNIAFTIQVVDTGTGEALTPVDSVQADLEAYSGETARKAVQLGQTQKVRITGHVGKVIAGWLAAGPDQRRTFRRLGR